MRRPGLVLLVAALCCIASGTSAFGLENVYRFPKIEPRLTLRAGFGFADTSGTNSRAGEFYYLKDSVVLGGEYIAFPFPHRLHLEAEVLNRKDYFSDLNYAFKDVVLTRWVGRSVYHNLENLALVDLGSNPGFTVLRRDVDEVYGVRTRIDRMSLRLKARDYPFHVYANASMIDREGITQQRFLGGSGWFNDIERVSESRSIDWSTREVTVGANSHLGPIEVDLSHGEKRFESEGGIVGSSQYSDAGFPPGSVRAAGLYPHSLVPTLEGSTNTLKLHTSYTGKLVGSVTLSSTERENVQSGAKSDYFTGSGELMWSPASRVGLSFKYRHREYDTETPDALPAGYLGFASYSAPITGIAESVSNKTDTYSVDSRFNLSRALSLNLGYEYNSTERSDTESKRVPISAKTIDNTYYASVKIRLPGRIKARVGYERANTSSPAYNTSPQVSDSGSATLTWTPLEWLRAFVSYKLTLEERDSTTFAGTEAGNREVTKSKVAGRLTFLINKRTSFTAGYTNLSNEVKQDVLYGSLLDADVSYEARAHNYMALLSYAYNDALLLGASVNHTRSRGSYSPDALSVASLSELKARETHYTVSGDYEVTKRFGIGLKVEHNVYEDLHEDPSNPQSSDGTAQVAFVTAFMKW